MSKITVEAVRERIAALESAGELSIKEQFYLDALRMLLASLEVERVAQYEPKFSRLWERYDEACHGNAEQMRDILELTLDALETAERQVIRLERYAEAEATGADKAAVNGIEWMQRAITAEKRIAELEGRAIKFPPKVERDDSDGYWMLKGQRVSSANAAYYNEALKDVALALFAAGIKCEVKGE